MIMQNLPDADRGVENATKQESAPSPLGREALDMRNGLPDQNGQGVRMTAALHEPLFG